MNVTVVPLPVPAGLKFDLILPDGYIVTIEMDDYQIRAYRGSIMDVLRAKILDWLEQHDYGTENLTITIA